MKKIFYILSICVMTILQPSCDALDLAPEDYYGAGNFWKEASQPKAFMLGLHAQLRSYYDMFYTLGELRGGTQRVGTSSLNTSLNYADSGHRISRKIFPAYPIGTDYTLLSCK